jgi:hypothetical protein
LIRITLGRVQREATLRLDAQHRELVAERLGACCTLQQTRRPGVCGGVGIGRMPEIGVLDIRSDEASKWSGRTQAMMVPFVVGGVHVIAPCRFKHARHRRLAAQRRGRQTRSVSARSRRAGGRCSSGAAMRIVLPHVPRLVDCSSAALGDARQIRRLSFAPKAHARPIACGRTCRACWIHT